MKKTKIPLSNRAVWFRRELSPEGVNSEELDMEDQLRRRGLAAEAAGLVGATLAGEFVYAGRAGDEAVPSRVTVELAAFCAYREAKWCVILDPAELAPRRLIVMRRARVLREFKITAISGDGTAILAKSRRHER